MSALYRLKAYFGMVPAEELDDFAHGEYPYDDHADHADHADTEYDRGYERQSERPNEREYARAGHAAPRAERPAVRAAGRWADGTSGAAGRRRDPAASDYYDEPELPAARERARRRNWAADAPVRGSLAVDPNHEVMAQPQPRRQPAPAEEAHPFARITTLHPRSYHEAITIGEHYRDGIPVIINLTEMADPDAKRLVDFSAGLVFALRGSFDKVTTKVFLLSPQNVDVTAEDKRRIAEGTMPRHQR